jgi:hypothetical protein
MGDRRFDLVLHGATGYVGRLAAAELVGRSGGLRIALSARNEQRLRAVQDELGGVDWPLLVTDAKDAPRSRRWRRRRRWWPRRWGRTSGMACRWCGRAPSMARRTAT